MSEALIEHLRDLFEPLGKISARAMFGGYGVYLDGIIIGVILDEALYLKTDEQTRADFKAAGCAPAVYEMRGKPLPMSYWSVPEEAMDSPQAMRPWAERAIAAARRKPAAKPRGKRAK
ncbi:TfoX/Sxy family protein [Lysobacter yangpyeongensis]|uniref:TfoX/Sxy family protein n=1 Tax=Lysobacter yangpyeongensis TaxID=346182 RepID=A0ABW0SLS3_9GAMM